MTREATRPNATPFYVGYSDVSPASLGNFTRRVAAGLIGFAALLSAGLCMGQGDFPVATFEFGTIRTFSGQLSIDPYPMLWIDRPGIQTASATPQPALLVGEFKFGADRDVSEYRGKRVELSGTLVYRDDQLMIEVASGSVHPLDENDPAPPPLSEDLGTVTLRGEIVDSKCFLGVMKPGNLKPHRECAVRCISGGIPPVLLVRDEQDFASYLLIVSESGGAIGRELLDRVAEPVRVTGRLKRSGETLFLHANASAFERVE